MDANTRLLCAGAAVLLLLLALTGLGGAWLLRRRRAAQIRARLKTQLGGSRTVTKPSPPLYHHPQFSMMQSSSIPFIPVTLAHSQSKVYDLKPPAAHAGQHLYRTPSQSSKHAKFLAVNLPNTQH